ncbi:hypothetical protein CPB83DRAFT_855654 [Crepidotus variabilis]|uniref:Uncharacterized protein n=1 Tax=Crepidotus variabilis TaxID=179855 RepID=A0A9P6JPH2_9AGAR|nr:hypothetical protein CPB83DRAFT_855654 [Crepidotus variabilis]
MSSLKIQSLLGQSPISENISGYVNRLAETTSRADPSTPAVKAYPDAVYFNFYKLGLSLQFAPKGGYRPTAELKQSELKNEQMALDSIYLYNIPSKITTDSTSKGTSSRSAELAFSTFPISPLVLVLNPNAKDKDGNTLSRPSNIEITPETSGKDFVSILGEPDRKGGGAGPSAGSIGIWCEWTKDGIMVEFGGDEAKGPQAWERGKDAVWKILTIFAPA